MGKGSPGVLLPGKYSDQAPSNINGCMSFSDTSCLWGLTPGGPRGETIQATLKKGADALPVLHKPMASPTSVYYY